MSRPAKAPIGPLDPSKNIDVRQRAARPHRLEDGRFACQVQSLQSQRSNRVEHIVLEIAFDSIHPSQRYASGRALRFRRIKSIRRDKISDAIDALAYARGLAEDTRKTLVRGAHVLPAWAGDLRT